MKKFKSFKGTLIGKMNQKLTFFVVIVSLVLSSSLVASSLITSSTNSVFAVKMNDPNYKWLVDIVNMIKPTVGSNYNKDAIILTMGCIAEAEQGTGIIKMDSKGLKEVTIQYSEGWNRAKICNEIADIFLEDGTTIKKDYKEDSDRDASFTLVMW